MGGSRVHRKSWDNDWDVHHLTFSTFGRQPFFPGKHAAKWFIHSLENARQNCPFHLFAYVIMPEHIHIILQPLPQVKISTILWKLKKPVTDAALSFVKNHHPDFLKHMADIQPSGKIAYRFWQRGGGYDRNMRSASDMNEKIGYIHDNPVRRGLVRQAEDWPYSSAGDWILQRKGSVTIDWKNLPEPEVR